MKDAIGVEIEIGKPIAYSQNSSFYFGIVEKFNPKMVKIKRVNRNWQSEFINRYPSDILMVDEKMFTLKMLKT